MPEGPEIWRTADGLNEALRGKTITNCFFYHKALKSFESKLEDRRVDRVEPRGKALLTYFDHDLCMYSHNQLYGKWFTTAAGERPDTNRSLRVVLENETQAALLYSASEIQVINKDDVAHHSYIAKLGADVVHPETSVEDILSQYEAAEFQNRKLTTLLLDQGFLSGVGNYLRSEILFYAGVDPTLKLRNCSKQQKRKLAEASRQLARRSYKTKGITNDPDIVEALKREGARRKDYRHFVYGRSGKYCHKCGSQVEHDRTGGRKVYYCSQCQQTSFD